MSTDSTTAKLTNESSGNATTKVLTGVQNTDPSRFIGTGVNFKAKLIGWEDVPESRGEKMCHVSMAKLKAVVVAMKEHKRQISLNISMEGIKLTDEKTQEILHNHPVHEISFIFRDSTDSRAFGYIHKVNENTHRFFGIKTEKAAANVINSLRDLFQAVYAMKKDEPSESKEEIKEQESPSNNEMNNNINNNVETKSEPMIKDEVPVEQTKKSNPSEDLFQLDEASNTTTAQNTAVAQSNAWLMQAFASSGQAGYPPAPTASAGVVTGPGSYPPQQPIMSAQVRQQTFYAQQQGGHPTPVWPPSSVPQGQFPNGYLANSGFPASSMATYGQQSRTFQATTVSSNQAGVNWSTFDQGGQTSTNDPFSFNGPASQPPVQAQAKLSPTSDPFKDLGNLSISTTTGIPLQANKRITKDDFNKDSPKPSLLDLSQQQPKQNQGLQAPKEQSADPFGLDTTTNPFGTSNDPFA